MIKDEQTIANLKKLKSFHNGSYGADIDRAIKALEGKDTNVPTKWIPVSERLPEKKTEVLATTVWKDVTIATMYSANDWLIHEGSANAEADEILAWMPLPDSYEKESEGEGRNMSRLEEVNRRIEKMMELAKLNPSGTYENMVALHLGTISVMLADISKSLAVIADKTERGVSNV